MIALASLPQLLIPQSLSTAGSALIPAQAGTADLPQGAHGPVCTRALLKGLQAHPSWAAATQGASALSPLDLHLAGTHHLEVPSSAPLGTGLGGGAFRFLLPHHSGGARSSCSSALASSSDQRGSVPSLPSPPLLSSAQVAELHRARRAQHPRLPSAVRTNPEHARTSPGGSGALGLPHGALSSWV